LIALTAQNPNESAFIGFDKFGEPIFSFHTIDGSCVP